MRRILLPLLLLTAAVFCGDGYNDYYKHRFKTSWKSYNDGLKNAVRLADRRQEVNYLVSLSTLYLSAGQPDSAKSYVVRAQKAALGSIPLSLIADVNAALFEKRPLDLSEDKVLSFEDSLPVYDVAALAVAAGRLALASGKNGQALALFKRAQKLLDKDAQSAGYANAVYWQAKALLKNGDNSAALQTAEKAAALFRKGEFVLGVRKSLKLQKEVLTASGETVKASAIESLLSRMPAE